MDIIRILYVDYNKEAVIAFLICTLIFVLSHFINFFRKNVTTTYNYVTHQSKVSFGRPCIIRKNGELCSDNSVYLTSFKSDGWTALQRHILCGYLTYFSDPINFFCLLVSIGQIYEYWDFRTLIPLSVFGTVSTLNHVYSMSILLAEQSKINYKRIKKMLLTDHNNNEKNIYQKDLKRGDFVKLNDCDEIPADIVILNSRTVLVQELELTGEDIVLNKAGMDLDLRLGDTVTINHKHNNGTFTTHDGNVHIYSSKNMLFRGTKIVDISNSPSSISSSLFTSIKGNELVGLVIEVGNDCQIYCINNEQSNYKTLIERKIINVCLTNLYLMLVIASFSGIVIYSKSSDGYSRSGSIHKKLWSTIRKMILLFNTMIPLSLQFFFNTASIILSKRISKDNNVTINRNGITSFQFSPHYIVSDKTGTITTADLELSNIFNFSFTSTDCNYFDVLQEPFKMNDDANIYLKNIIACSEVQVHSRSGEILKNDIIEERLLSYFLHKTGTKLIQNTKSDFVICRESDKKIFKRHFYQQFDYKLEVKIAVISCMDGPYELHIQGTPEAIDKYSKSKFIDKLRTIESLPRKKNSYRRIIAHAWRYITRKELEILFLKKDQEKILKNMLSPSLYVFNDYVIDKATDAVNALLAMGKDFTLLTGDKMSSAVSIGETIGIISDNKVIVVDTIRDIESLEFCDDKKDMCYVLNGRLLDILIATDKYDQLKHIIDSSNKRIIYRACPNSKQKFISCLQGSSNKDVLMIGDGSNDVAAIIQSNVGITVRKSDNANVQNIAKIIVEDFTVLPQLLEKFSDYQVTISNICPWVIMKHMINAFMLVIMLLISNFEKIRDPASPFMMSILNGSMFVCMCAFCSYDNPKYTIHTGIKFSKMIFRGIFLGILNGFIIFSVFDVNKAINIALSVEVIELVLQLYNLTCSRDKKMIGVFATVVMLWILALFIV